MSIIGKAAKHLVKKTKAKKKPNKATRKAKMKAKKPKQRMMNKKEMRRLDKKGKKEWAANERKELMAEMKNPTDNIPF